MKRGPALQRPGRLQFLQSAFLPCVPQLSSRPPLGLSLCHACHLQQTLSAPQGILILPIHPEQLSLASASSGRSAQITPRLGILFAHRLFLARVRSSHTQGREEVLEHESSQPKPWTNGCQELVDDASTRTLGEKTLRCAYYTGSHGAQQDSAPPACRGNVYDHTPSISCLPFPVWFPL